MRNLKLVVATVLLSAAVGGTALAADTSTPAGGNTKVATAVHKKVVKHKVTHHKAATKKKGAAAKASGTSATH
jgi:hypothetical protein